jgi:SAM-dependent methyltransferase
MITPIDNGILYAQRFQDKQNARKRKIWGTICEHFLQKYIPSESVVMDIAAGNCEFINAIEAKEKIAVDVNSNIYAHVFGNIQVINDSFFNLGNYTDKKCDIIFASNIFEHLNSKEEVISAIKICYQHLVPGGKLLILQPNIKFTGGAYWDFIDHKVPLTEKSLIEAGKLAGFTITKNISRFLPYTTKSSIPQNPFFVFLYLKLPFLWFFLGKQSFLVMAK